MKQKPELPYEEAAEQRTVTGWACKTCSLFYGDKEDLARWCCAKDMPCPCGKRCSKGRTCCDECRQKHDDERYQKLSEADWDGESPLVLFMDDRYFFDIEDIIQYMDDHDIPDASHLQFELCERAKPRHFDAEEFCSDDMYEDQELDGAEEINATVNAWLAKQKFGWFGRGVKPTRASLPDDLFEPRDSTTDVSTN